VGQIVHGVSKDCNAIIFKVKQSKNWTAWPWRWRNYDHLKRVELLTQWCHVTSQKTWIFCNNAVRTSNLTKPENLYPNIYVYLYYLLIIWHLGWVPKFIAHILVQNKTNCESSMELSVHLLNTIFIDKPTSCIFQFLFNFSTKKKERERINTWENFSYAMNIIIPESKTTHVQI
jgi:hypothetical protein